MTFIRNCVSITLLFSLTASLAFAEPSLPNTVKEMRVELDVVNFDISDNDAKVERLKVLVPHSEELAEKNTDDAGFQMMAGFYNAQYAGYTGGLGALKHAKAARKFLEKSVELDPKIYGSSAHAVLGSLYAQVPGWPVGFGDKKKALKNYQAALEISPNSVDSNFTYAGYLFNQKKYSEAKIYLQKASVAPARPDRPKADKNVQEQIPKYMEEIDKRLAKEK